MYDIAIIGGGPAGLTAGIYAARAGHSAVVIEKNYPGGQIISTHLMENYPGFPEGISGFDFGERVKAQAERCGVEITMAEVLGVEQQSGYRVVKTEEGNIECKALIIASGATPRKLGLEGEDKFTGLGISYCATCDGAFFKGREVCVVGGGDTALEDALYLANIAKKVYLIHRRNEFRAQSVLVERAKAAENIEFLLEREPVAILGNTDFEGLALRKKSTGEVEELKTDGCFLAIGYVPDTAYLNGVVNLDRFGYIIAGEDAKTGASGIFAAGDVRTKKLRQVVTAVSDGAAAALAASEYVEENK